MIVQGLNFHTQSRTDRHKQENMTCEFQSHAQG
jgi:hypothetical protein